MIPKSKKKTSAGQVQLAKVAARLDRQEELGASSEWLQQELANINRNGKRIGQFAGHTEVASESDSWIFVNLFVLTIENAVE